MKNIEENEIEECNNWHSLFGCYMKYILNIADQKNDPSFTKRIKKKLFDLSDDARKKGFINNVNGDKYERNKK